jgi:hypothetical protein
MTTLGLTQHDVFAATAEAARHRREVDAAVAAERSRCAAVCREVADARLAACRDRPYDGRADVADECAEAIERGAVAR